MYKLDLHTHSMASPDSVTSLSDLEDVFAKGQVDQIAITDHDEDSLARKALKKFGASKIIPGQEITTKEKKHIIALYASQFIPRGLPFQRTAELIKNHNGLIYAPHPFDPSDGLGEDRLITLLNNKLLDIIEVFNGWQRFLPIIGMRKRSQQNARAKEFAQKHDVLMTASSDAHTAANIGKSHIVIAERVDQKNLLEMLKESQDKLVTNYNTLNQQVPKAAAKMARSLLPFQ